MNVTIKPSKLEGSIMIPPSKSLSHRAIIAASLALGKSVISNVLYSKDIKATIEAMRACGAIIEEYDDYLVIYGSKVKRVKSMINANESGSTIRFMIPIALVCDAPMEFRGENHLVKRPLDTFLEIFDLQGISYERGEDYLPLKVKSGIKSGVYKVRGDISSQFITGLLYALPILDGDSKIEITTTLESKGYIDLTLDMLKKFGIQIENRDYKEFYIKGNQSYTPCDYTIEGDFSQSAFFLVADCLGANIKLKAMNMDSHQGDKKILKDIEDFSSKIHYENDELYADSIKTKGAIIDFSQSPDLGPALTVLASLSEGKSEFINAGRLRIKECDRITCMKEELEKLGANIIEHEDGMEIFGVDSFTGGVIDSHNDHRVAMSFAMASIKAKGDIKILNAGCVSKSYPNFWEVFERLGGKIEYEE
ncbi:3-phosphoshikimate 1-carboxyvinyltransferase [Anaeroplasma bactoclasticum]|jgi:3-phosphoshikimate 1-carboxyvinyltransferase|uniref:3-phosphoshikimate 1-carboxyvinyltransferase n=1 Tax=Anaeroplasma bactoclasticum TaxID=2088 RepID=A0A397S086_9MOLU|nr:3-phosphoshikimate 1-carboxyvinyltransferase [Anaeroplasma bactoclasticum]RIA75584.1 3-phosphoshikimate 1-carboxyvinyltransferase [Anaeroplasma bactoclasticum]